MWISVEDLWISGLQVLGIGFAIGIAFGDCLDRMDVFHWKGYVALLNRREQRVWELEQEHGVGQKGEPDESEQELS